MFLQFVQAFNSSYVFYRHTKLQDINENALGEVWLVHNLAPPDERNVPIYLK